MPKGDYQESTMSEQDPTERKQSDPYCNRDDLERLEEATDSDVADAIAELEGAESDDE
ncbi:hypothetical protein [Natronobacterium lacisalsi]|uniref:hypothetical protein n=1 Tax=Natronobacterium lacisalsi TaxID=229731 RepID=UPI0012EBDD33|nr:hypothetical protein [Halobiforma lacisalsi]